MVRTQYTFSNLRMNSIDIIQKAKPLINAQINTIESAFRQFDDFVQELETQPISVLRNVKLILSCKMLNHVFSAFVLAENGLFVDAILCERNAIETIAYYWLICRDESFAEKYNQGIILKPIEVRKTLERLGVEISNLKALYSSGSEISHIGRRSETFFSSWDSPNKWLLNYGGSSSLADQNELFRFLPSLLFWFIDESKKSFVPDQGNNAFRVE